eukprot:GHUV01006103.1.p1 GENE.GHUV01006103.1~~GHUV01006103.1.p1  ORF type:complete len:892 (+),score=345.95 GHUV01006103.1:153-2828(+)
MAVEDFNPTFSFDVGDLEGPAQAPWEFGGALKMALQDHKNSSTINDKISKRLQERSSSKVVGKKRAREESQNEELGDESDAADSDSDSEAADSSDEGEQLSSDADSDSEDEPLPGEVDSDDASDTDLADEVDSSDDDDDDNQPAAATAVSQRGKQKQQQVPATAAAAAAARRAAAVNSKAAMANGVGGGSSSSESEDEQSDIDHEHGSSDEDGSDAEQDDQAAAAAGEQQQERQPAAAAVSGKGTKKGFYAETQQGFKQTGVSFQDLQLSRPLLRAVAALGYEQPMPIQAACIPLALSGRDICGSAMTGSGKTAAFALPILERLLYRPRQVAATYVLILAPARELAVQIHSMIQKLAQFTDIDAALIVGGLSLPAQAAALRAGPAIVVATPGRIIDHVRNSQGFGLEDLSILVLDEADRLLEMGFKEELREILRLAPKQRQTMLFSATFNDDVAALVSLSLKQPVRLAADPAAAAPKQLSQEIVRLKGQSGNMKEAVLMALCSRSFKDGRTIVFCKTKQQAHRLKILFGLCKLPPAAELHGDMTQAARLQSLEKFRQGEVAFLLATDVAARGLDILGVQVVLNFDAPRTLETYLHRIGRTARAGAQGVAVTLVGDDDRVLLKEVVKKGKVQLKQRLVPSDAIKRWQATVEGAEADVEQVLREEREEAYLRKAEMEAKKAENLLEHESEIFSRPARTWFQTEKQKKELAAAAAAAAEGRTVLEDAAGPASSKSSKAAKAAAKQDKRNAKLKEQRAKEAAEGKKAVPALQQETEQFSKAIKGVKSRMRELMQQGLTAKAAKNIAQKAVTGVSTKHEKKKCKTSDSGGLFSGDGTGKPGSNSNTDKPAAAGGSSGGSKSAKAKGNLSKTELNRVKRGGKGKAAFKSKKKFKRRR